MKTKFRAFLVVASILVATSPSYGHGGRGGGGGGFSGGRSSGGGFARSSGGQHSAAFSARSGGGGFHQNFRGGFEGGRFGGGRFPERHFDRHRFHDRAFFGFPFFFGYSYPYDYYPYGYPYYSAPYYDGDYAYPGSSPYTVYNSGGPAAGSSGTGQPGLTYYQLGQNWGQDLRQNIVTWDQFVDYVKNSFANVSSTTRDEFRRGFVAGYGSNADLALDKALDQAGLATSPDGETQ